MDNHDITTQDLQPSVDDLKLIRGIGLGIENRLHAANIFTYLQLASMTPKEITESIGKFVGMTVDKLIEQNWIGQARELATNKRTPTTLSEIMIPNSHQHYAVFTIELLLDEENHARRTRTLYIQRQVESVWSGWDQIRLVDFIVTNAGLNFSITGKSADQYTNNSGKLQQHQTPADETSSTTTPSQIQGGIQFQNIIIFKDSESAVPREFINSDRPFNIRLVLDFSRLIPPPETPLKYSALVFAKKLGGIRQIISKSEGEIIPNDGTQIELRDLKLTPGVYLIEAYVEVNPTNYPEKHLAGLRVYKRGDLVQVY